MSPSADDRWGARIARARRLAAAVPEAADLLTFLAALSERQRSLVASSLPLAVAVPDTRASALDPVATLEPALARVVDRAAVVAAIPRLLEWLPGHAPPALATAATLMQSSPGSDWRQRLDRFLDDGADDADPHRAFVVEATVQPFAELGAGGREWGPRGQRPLAAGCPFCGRPPALATLREAGHGARRSLQCGVCLTEWSVPRIGCAACGEARFERLPKFSADEVSAARLEACDTCHGYLKTIDFTRDGHALPVVDDVATLSLDLWAREQGYTRLRPHLLRV